MIAITGASGHIGANLCRELVSQGYAVRVMYRSDDKPFEGLEVEKVQGDILDEKSLERLIHGAKYVYHLAAKVSINGDPDDSVWKINVEGTRKVIEACKRAHVKRLIHFSSLYAIDQNGGEVNEKSPNVSKGNASVYNYSKAISEELVQEAVQRGLDAIILNPAGVLGGYDHKPSLMGQTLIDLAKGQLPALVNGGFGWVDVLDIVDAAIQAMEKGRKGERYILTGPYQTIPQLAKVAYSVSGQRPPILSLPIWLARIGVPFAKISANLSGKTPRFTQESLDALAHGSKHLSWKKAEEELEFQPRPLVDSLHIAYQWFEKLGLLNE